MYNDFKFAVHTIFNIIFNFFRLTDDIDKNCEISRNILKRGKKAGKFVINVVGYENIPECKKGVLYVANHQSMLDILVAIVMLDRQLSFVGKKQLRKFFGVGIYLEKMGGISIDRDSVKSQIKSLKYLREGVKNGQNVFVFPEGTRAKDVPLLPFKAGTFNIALKTKCDVVPITFIDNNKVLGTKNRDIKVIVGKAITHDEYKEFSSQELAEHVESIVRNNLEKGFNFDEAIQIN